MSAIPPTTMPGEGKGHETVQEQAPERERTREDGRRAAAFFDMDRTIVAGDTASIFFAEMRERGQLGLGEVARLLAIRLGYRLALVDMPRAMARIFRTLEGKSEAVFSAHCQGLFDARIAPLIAPAAAAAIREHRARGDAIVLLTAQTQYLARPLAERMQIENILCTQLGAHRGRLTGVSIGEVCYGRGKTRIAAAWARGAGIDLAESYFYTVSFTDLPMLEAVGRPRVTNPDPRLALYARRRRWPILRFDPPAETGLRT